MFMSDRVYLRTLNSSFISIGERHAIEFVNFGRTIRKYIQQFFLRFFHPENRIDEFLVNFGKRANCSIERKIVRGLRT